MNKEEILEKLYATLHRKNIFSSDQGFELFCKAFGYEPARHHKLIIEKLERCMLDPGYKVVIQAPPGHAKSTYSSVLAPAYYLGRFPSKKIILAGHTHKLVRGFGRMARSIVESEKYDTIFGSRLTKSSKATNVFELTNGSRFYASGIKGGITGERSNFTIIDDPIRGYKDADSLVIRDTVYHSYIYDLVTRVVPNSKTSFAIVLTRWHEDDLVGRILNSSGGKYWDVVSLPAIAEKDDILGRPLGEPLWPESYPMSVLEEIFDSLGGFKSRACQALFQQKPTCEDGSFFLSEWIQLVDSLPENLSYYGGSDYAVTENGGDYTVHIVAGHDRKTDNIYIVDLWRGQTTANVWIESFLDISDKYKPRMWAEESGQIIKSVGPYIEKSMQERNIWVPREQFVSSTNKPSRARSIQALMARKKVFILNNQRWTNSFIDELMKFPTGRNDDQVDAFSILGRLMDHMRISIAKPSSKWEYDYKDGKIRMPSWNEKIKYSY